MKRLFVFPSDDLKPSAFEELLAEAEEEERASSSGCSTESSNDGTTGVSLLEKLVTGTAHTGSQSSALEFAGTSASGAAAAALSSAARAGGPGPRCHPFFAVPELMPGNFRDSDVSWALGPTL